MGAWTLLSGRLVGCTALIVALVAHPVVSEAGRLRQLRDVHGTLKDRLGWRNPVVRDVAKALRYLRTARVLMGGALLGAAAFGIGTGALSGDHHGLWSLGPTLWPVAKYAGITGFLGMMGFGLACAAGVPLHFKGKAGELLEAHGVLDGQGILVPPAVRDPEAPSPSRAGRRRARRQPRR